MKKKHPKFVSSAKNKSSKVTLPVTKENPGHRITVKAVSWDNAKDIKDVQILVDSKTAPKLQGIVFKQFENGNLSIYRDLNGNTVGNGKSSITKHLFGRSHMRRKNLDKFDMRASNFKTPVKSKFTEVPKVL